MASAWRGQTNLVLKFKIKSLQVWSIFLVTYSAGTWALDVCIIMSYSHPWKLSMGVAHHLEDGTLGLLPWVWLAEVVWVLFGCYPLKPLFCSQVIIFAYYRRPLSYLSASVLVSSTCQVLLSLAIATARVNQNIEFLENLLLWEFQAKLMSCGEAQPLMYAQMASSSRAFLN